MELRDFGRFLIGMIGCVIGDAIYIVVSGGEGLGIGPCVTIAAAATILQALRDPRP